MNVVRRNDLRRKVLLKNFVLQQRLAVSNSSKEDSPVNATVNTQEDKAPQFENQENIPANTGYIPEDTAASTSSDVLIISSSTESDSNSESFPLTAEPEDNILNTSRFSFVSSLFKSRHKRVKGIQKAKNVTKGVKSQKQPSLSSRKEKDAVLTSKKSKSLFSLFKSRKEGRKIVQCSKNDNPGNSTSNTPETTSQSCQTDIVWPEVGYDDLQRHNQVLKESNRVLCESLSTLMQDLSTKTATPQPLSICTDTYGVENIDPQQNFNNSRNPESVWSVKTRSNTSKLVRSQTVLEKGKGSKTCTRSKSMNYSDGSKVDNFSSRRTNTKTLLTNLPHSSARYQLRSTHLQSLPLNSNRGINHKYSVPDRMSGESMRPLLRRRSNNWCDFKNASVSYSSQSSVTPNSNKPPFNNELVINARKPVLRRSSMPIRVPNDQFRYQQRPTVQRRNTLSFQDKYSYRQGEYCRRRFQDLPSEAFY